MITLTFAGCSSSDTRTELGGDDIKPVVTAEAPEVTQDQVSTTTAKTSTTQFDPDNFTTEGKPTTTIGTPWGPREVYDPTQVPEIREYFKNWHNHSESISLSGYTIEMYRFFHNNPKHKYKQQIIEDARRIQALDYARHQCMRQTYWAGCSEEDFVFKEPCLTDHNLHSKDLSKCEDESMAFLWGSGNKCHYEKNIHDFYNENGALYERNLPALYAAALRELPFEDALYAHYARICNVWRGQLGHDYWVKHKVRSDVLPRGRGVAPYGPLNTVKNNIKLLKRK